MLAADVVISEIMYHPQSENPLDEFIELYNRGDEAANLLGMQFTDGVEFTLGELTLSAGSYLVVAADLARFQANHPGVTNVVGGWTGELSNTSEKIELADSTGLLIDEVTYADEGDWAARRRGPLDRNHFGWIWQTDHDGIGKSAELINPAQSNNNGQNWAASIPDGGTPGAANSAFAADIAPIVSDVEHSPAIPRSTDFVTIRAEVDDEQDAGLTVQVLHRSSDFDNFTATTMFDDGLHDDDAADDGIYGVVLPPQPHGTVIEFYVRATDATEHTRTWPAATDAAGTQAANALYQVDNGYYAGEAPLYRLILTETERFELEQMGITSDNDSNAQMNATFISSIGDDVEIRYNVGQRLRGASSRDFNIKSYRINFPSDRDWQSVTGINLNARSIYSQIAGSAIFAAAGLPAAEATLAQVRVNGQDLSGGAGYAHLEVTDGDFVANHFDDDNGNLYNKRRPGNGADTKWAYRNGNLAQYPNDGWDKDTNSGLNDWTDLDAWLNALNNAPDFTYVQSISPHINIDQWLRWFAMMTLLDSNETNPSIGADDDYAVYRGAIDPRFVLLPHDLDSVLGNQGSSPTAGIFRMLVDGGGLPQLEAFFSHPDIVPRYYAQLRELATTVFAAENFGPLLQNLLGGNAPQPTIDAMRAFMATRVAHVLAQIPSTITISSALPTSNGYLRTTTATTTLNGLAPVEGTQRVLINGEAVGFNPRTGAWTSGLPELESETLLPERSTWKYNDQGVDLGTTWRTAAYNDASWATGAGQLGFGDGDEVTTLVCGPTPTCDANNTPTFYFRRTINIPNPTDYTGLIFRVMRDDGVAVYLNGTEVVRDNLPPNATFSTVASTFVNGGPESEYFEFFVPASHLVAGVNVLAAEVHQNATTSSDISFDMAIEGLTTDVTPVTLLPRGSSQWKYLDTGVNQGTGWIAPGFNDAAWPTGTAQFGYGDGDEATLINCGSDPQCDSNNIPTYYFRKSFTVANAQQINTLRLRLMRDDGAAVYINGQEVARSNLPANATFTTLASGTVGGGDENTFFEFEVNPQVLINGTNVIAVEVHQQSATSSDVSFDLELVGTATSGEVEENVPLVPGINRVLVQAIGANNQELARQTIDIWYDDSTAPIYTGTIAANTTWTAANGPHRVSGELIIATGATLTIEPGATVFFNPGASLNVHGRLLAVGTDTQHIRFARLPTAVGDWNGMSFDHPSLVSRLVNVDIEGAGAADTLTVNSSSIEVERVTFGPTNHSVLEFTNSSILVRDSAFPSSGPGTLIVGSGIPTGKRVLIERNTFPARPTSSPTIELRNAQRPGPVYQVYNNNFAGHSFNSAALVLAGADAFVEGNHFTGFTSSGGAAVVLRGDGGLATRATLGRNVIANNATGIRVLDASRLTSQSNTLANNSQTAVSFGQGAEIPGQAATLSGDIVWGAGAVIVGARVDDPTYGTTEVHVDDSLVPDSAATLGARNISADPRFANTTTYALSASSPAIAAGPQGQNLGASAPSGAVVGGEPVGTTTSNAATLIVGGAGVVSYRYRLNGGAISAEFPISQAIALSNLANGNYTVQIIARNAAGTVQSIATAVPSDTWTVNTALSRVRISEVLALNQTAVPHAGIAPDYVELHNDGATPIDLSGMMLSDDPTFPAKYLFPAGTAIAPGEYLTLYADANSTSPDVKLKFGLNGSGDAIYLFAADETIVDQVTFGVQIPDLSIGRLADGTWALTQPTPNSVNLRKPMGDPSRLVINEWLATSDRLLGEDFVELYNPDPLPVSLAGIAITDNYFAAPRAHEFAPLSFVAGGGYGVFLAEGDSTQGADHLSFKLSAWREALMLVDAASKPIDVVLLGAQSTDVSEGRSPDGGDTYQYFTVPSPGLPNLNAPVATQPILAVDHQWRYEDSGTNLGTAWREPGYNDTFWSTGAGILHFEDETLPGPKNTPLNLGSTTYYYRTEFNPDSLPDIVEQLQLSLLVDDGAVVYLNGVELFRVGMPAGNINHNTLASRHISTAAFEGPFTIARSSLLPGVNVLAVEVHQDEFDSSDTVFAATLDAVLPPTDPRTINTFALLDNLRIAEMLYNGSAGETSEFVELVNIGDTPLDLTGVRFTRGIDYTFGAVMLAPGERIVVAQNVAAFEAVYGTGINVVGNFTGSLANGGEAIKLTLPSPLTGAIEEFEYLDDWYPATDGNGYSLVVRDVTQRDASLDDSAAWRSSYFLGGTPGVDDGGQVVINEVLANSTSLEGDWIEIRNTTDHDIDLGSWLLTDDLTAPVKYLIPPGTTLPAGGFIVFDQATSFGGASAAVPFELNSMGGQVHLVGADSLENLTGYVATLNYGATESGATVGIHARVDGDVDVTRLSSATRGAANALPAIGPIVVSEVMYNPAAGGDEFIELLNTTAEAITLHDADGPASLAWRLDGAVSFTFPAGASLAASGRALVVGIDPETYRTTHRIPAEIAIYGPYAGDLGNAADDLQLLRPDAASPASLLLIDRVSYTNDMPWPRSADGRGSALIRTAVTAYGNDAASWLASNLGGTPGVTNRSLDTTAPSAPTALSATAINATQNDLSWTAAADAESGIAVYRIYRNGAVIGTSTLTTFSDHDAPAGQSYSYEVAAINGDSLVGPRSNASIVSTLGILTAGSLNETTVVVVFSQQVTSATAEAIANYTIAGVTINSATLGADGRTVTLVTAALTAGRNYTLEVANVAAAGGGQLPPGVSTSFRAAIAGITVRDVKASSTNSPSNLAQAENLLAQPPDSSAILSERTAIVPAVDFSDPDSPSGGRFGLNQPYPNNTAGVNDDYFALRVTGTVYIPYSLAGAWTFGTRNDDGLRLRIDGEDVIVDPSGHGPTDFFATVTLSVGFHTFEIHYWDGIQGAMLEFFAARGTFTEFGQTNTWRLVGDTANGGLAATTQPIPVDANVDWQRAEPSGSGVFEFSSTGSIAGTNSFQDFDVPLLAGQTLSVTVDPESATAFMFVIVLQDDLPIAAAQSVAPGATIALNHLIVSAAGEYTLRVSGTDPTNFSLFATLNAAIERETASGIVQQVARSVIDFSSEYTTTSWSAAQALGAPNTPTYGDSPTAWAPVPINGTTEFLTLGYDVPVYATGAIIVETYGNGFVRRVETLDMDGQYHIVWEGADNSQPGTPANFRVTFPQTTYLVSGLRVTIDTNHNLETWEEIDAVILEGVQATASSSNNTVATAQSLAVSNLPVGPGLSRMAVSGTVDATTFDFYRVEVEAGQTISLALSGADSSALELAIVDALGQPLAIGIESTVDVALSIPTFVAGAAGPVFVRVGGVAATQYTLVAVVGGGFSVEPNNDSQSAIDVTPSGSALGYVGEGAAGSGEPGTGPSVSMPLVLNDGEGFRWDIGSEGAISDGTNDAYDGGMDNQAFGDVFQATLENNNREVLLGPSSPNPNVSISRKIFVPDDDGYARFLEIVTNTSGAPLTFQVPIYTNLGSDGTTGELVTTSSGDNIFTTADQWILTDDSDGSNDPTMLHIIAGPGGAGPTTVNATGSGSVAYTYSVTLQPGETKIVMHFAAQSANRATALAKAESLVALERGALSGMTAEELRQVVNFRPADTADVFSVWAAAGDVLTISTSTPAVGFAPYGESPDGPSGTNSLDPVVELVDAAGNMLASDDSSASDGRNSLLVYTIAEAGQYFVRVAAKAGSGEFGLSVAGATGSAPAAAVKATTPVDGAAFKPAAFPTTITVDLSANIAPASVAAADLTVNGIAAESVEQVDGDTLRFTLPASVNTGERTYDVAIAAGTLTDVNGGTLLAYAGTFRIDGTAPRLIDTTFNGGELPAGAKFATGPLAATFKFDEAVFQNNQFLSVYLIENNRNQFSSPLSFSFDESSTLISVEWPALREGNYTVYIEGNGLADAVGNFFDGEPIGTNPDHTISGNGTPGGSYSLDFTVDNDVTDVDPTWRRTGGLGTLALDANPLGNVTFVGDTDAFSFDLAAGESIDAVAYPIRPGMLSMRLIGPGGNTIATTSATAAGEVVHLGGYHATAAGEYRVEVSGDTADQDYRLNLTRNASPEPIDAGGTIPTSLNPSSSTLAGQRWSVIGESTPRVVGDYLQAQGSVNNVWFPNQVPLTFTRTGRPRGDAMLDITALAYLQGQTSYLSLYAEGHHLGDVFVNDGNAFTESHTTLAIPQTLLESLTEDGAVELLVVPSQNVFNLSNTYINVTLNYSTAGIVWGVRPAEGDIVVIDPETGAVIRSFPAPDALAANHTRIGLTAAENGSSLLYINSDVDPSLIYRLDPTTGTVLGTSTVTGGGYDGLGYDGNADTATIYSADMATNPGWTFTGQWSYGQPTGNSGGGFPDPTSGVTGPNVVGYNLNGPYAANLNTTHYATTPAIDARGVTGTTLSFYRWLGLESCCDSVNIQVSNNGTNWVTIWEVNGGDEITDANWRLQTFDISAVADNQQNVRVRWGLGPTDSSVQYGGWNLDDVKITGQRAGNPKLILSRRDDQLVRQEGLNGDVTANWATGAPRGAVAGDDTGRAFALFGDGLIHEFDPDTDTNAFIGNPITPPAGDIEGLAFDGGLLFASTASGVLYTIDPNTGAVISQLNVPEGGLYGLATGAQLVPAEPYAIVPQGSVWKYFDRGQNLGTAWRERVYNDATWSSGPARLGYGGDGEVTTVGYGPSGGNKYPTTYFRHSFNVEDPQAIEALNLELVRDDGAAVYLNGTLVVLDNLSFEAPYGAYSNYAVSDAEEQQWFSYAIEPSMLRAGENVLAVELHQASAGSTDLGFDLRMTATPRPPVVADTDLYSIDLTGRAGHAIDVILDGAYGINFHSARLELLDANGSVLATGQELPTDENGIAYDVGIQSFVVPADGIYRLRVTSSVESRYVLSVVDGAVFDTEPNNLASDSLRSLDGTRNAAGFAFAQGDPVDFYTLTLAAGESVRLVVETPLDLPMGTPPFNITPKLEIYQPDGALGATASELPDGTNPSLVFTATAAGVYRIGVGAESGFGEYRLRVESTSPAPLHVVDVLAGSSQWNAVMNTKLAAAPGAAANSLLHSSDAAPTTLPWSGINQLAIKFSADANVLAEHLQLRGLSTAAYAIAGFTYDPATFTAIWTFAAPIDIDNLLVTLSDAVKDNVDERLDGNGDSTPGGAFQRRFHVLPGDATGDGRVSALDAIAARNHSGAASDPAYLARADVNGSGAVDLTDVSSIAGALFSTSPSGEPQPTAMVADLNRDGRVGLQDLSMLQGHFNQPAAGFESGDLNGDGMIDVADVAMFVSHLGETSSAPAEAIVAQAAGSSIASRQVAAGRRVRVDQAHAADRAIDSLDASLTARTVRRVRAGGAHDSLAVSDESPSGLRATRRTAARTGAVRDHALSDIIDGS